MKNGSTAKKCGGQIKKSTNNETVTQLIDLIKEV